MPLIAKPVASVLPSSAVPTADSGSGSAGVSTLYARGDHQHPASSGGGGLTTLVRMTATPGISASGTTDTNGIFTANPTLVKGSASIAANTAAVGDKITYRAMGTFSNGAAVSQQPGVYPHLGAGILFTVSTLSLAPGNYSWKLESEYAVVTAGASGVVHGLTTLQFINNSTGAVLADAGTHDGFVTPDFTTALHTDFEIYAGGDPASSLVVTFAEVLYTPHP